MSRRRDDDERQVDDWRLHLPEQDRDPSRFEGPMVGGHVVGCTCDLCAFRRRQSPGSGKERNVSSGPHHVRQPHDSHKDDCKCRACRIHRS